MNPYAILAAGVLWLASCAGSAWLGWDYRDGKVAKEKTTAVEKALEDAQADTVIDMQAAADRARSDAIAEERARNAKEKGIQDATLKARPDCSRDAESLGLLHDAIDAANHPAPGAGRVPEALP